jgi:hypothetical protein
MMDKFSKYLKCAIGTFTRTSVCHIPKFFSSESVRFYECTGGRKGNIFFAINFQNSKVVRPNASQ